MFIKRYVYKKKGDEGYKGFRIKVISKMCGTEIVKEAHWLKHGDSG